MKSEWGQVEVVNVNGGSFVADSRPTHDQIYLMERINEEAEAGHITIPGIVKLNKKFGIGAVVSAMRLVRGFCLENEIRSAYAYVARVCEEQR